MSLEGLTRDPVLLRVFESSVITNWLFHPISEPFPSYNDLRQSFLYQIEIRPSDFTRDLLTYGGVQNDPFKAGSETTLYTFHHVINNVALGSCYEKKDVGKEAKKAFMTDGAIINDHDNLNTALSLDGSDDYARLKMTTTFHDEKKQAPLFRRCAAFLDEDDVMLTQVAFYENRNILIVTYNTSAEDNSHRGYYYLLNTMPTFLQTPRGALMGAYSDAHASQSPLDIYHYQRRQQEQQQLLHIPNMKNSNMLGDFPSEKIPVQPEFFYSQVDFLTLQLQYQKHKHDDPQALQHFVDNLKMILSLETNCSLLMRTSVSQVKQCPGCISRNVICVCDPLYKAQFFPNLRKKDYSLHSFLKQVEVGRNGTFFNKVCIEFPHIGSSSKSFYLECFHDGKISCGLVPTYEFAKQEYLKVTKLQYSAPSVFSGMGYVSVDLPSLFENQNFYNEYGPDSLTEEVKEIFDKPLEFFLQLSISDKKKRKLLQAATSSGSTNSQSLLSNKSTAEDTQLKILQQTSNDIEVDGSHNLNVKSESFELPEAVWDSSVCVWVDDPGHTAGFDVNAHASSHVNNNVAKKKSDPKGDNANGDQVQRVLSRSKYSSKDANKNLSVHRSGNSESSTKKSTVSRTCTLCGKILNRPADLKRHMIAVHENRRSYQCMFCDQKFQMKWHLSTHINGMHKNTTRYECSICDILFNRKNELSKHNKLVHDGKATS